MDANKIMQSDLLDLVFDGRNKSYGAYELRSRYAGRMTTALLITGGIVLVIVLGSFMAGKPASEDPHRFQGTVIELIDLSPREEKPQPPPVERVKELPKVKTTRYVTPRVVKDTEVPPVEKSPEVRELGDARIGLEDQEGPVESGNGGVPTGQGTGDADTGEEAHSAGPWEKVEVEAEFPGGLAGWTKFLTREIERNMDELQDEGRSGTVTVQFIVDRDGAVSDVRVMDCASSGLGNCLGPDSRLAEVAVNAIRRGPRWKPAMQNGRQVKAYRRQPVTFRLAAGE